MCLVDSGSVERGGQISRTESSQVNSQISVLKLLHTTNEFSFKNSLLSDFALKCTNTEETYIYKINLLNIYFQLRYSQKNLNIFVHGVWF